MKYRIELDGPDLDVVGVALQKLPMAQGRIAEIAAEQAVMPIIATLKRQAAEQNAAASKAVEANNAAPEGSNPD